MLDPSLLNHLRVLASNPDAATEMSGQFRTRIYGPSSERAIELAELQLGFSITAELRQLYLHVANGGFGPGYGLLGLEGGAVDDLNRSSVELYKSFREPDPSDPYWSWPEGLLPIVHLGCAMYFCEPCVGTSRSVIWFEPNPHEDGASWESSFLDRGLTLEQLLRAWIEKRDYWGAAAPLWETFG